MFLVKYLGQGNYVWFTVRRSFSPDVRNWSLRSLTIDIYHEQRALSYSNHLFIFQNWNLLLISHILCIWVSNTKCTGLYSNGWKCDNNYEQLKNNNNFNLVENFLCRFFFPHEMCWFYTVSYAHTGMGMIRITWNDVKKILK